MRCHHILEICGWWYFHSCGHLCYCWLFDDHAQNSGMRMLRISHVDGYILQYKQLQDVDSNTCFSSPPKHLSTTNMWDATLAMKHTKQAFLST